MRKTMWPKWEISIEIEIIKNPRNSRAKKYNKQNEKKWNSITAEFIRQKKESVNFKTRYLKIYSQSKKRKKNKSKWVKYTRFMEQHQMFEY